MRALLRWFRRHQTSLILALGLGLLALSGWLLLAPTHFTVGIPIQDSVESDVIGAYSEALKQQRKDVRLRVLKFEDYAASSRALENGTVDLALADYSGNAGRGADNHRAEQEEDRQPEQACGEAAWDGGAQ